MNIIQIEMLQIIVDSHKLNIQPYIGKANKLVQYYKRHKTLDKPIIVLKNKDKYLSYYLAKKLGLLTADAIVDFDKIVS